MLLAVSWVELYYNFVYMFIWLLNFLFFFLFKFWFKVSITSNFHTSLMQTITWKIAFFVTCMSPDRYRHLLDINHQEQFLDVQLFLLEHFITRLKLESNDNSFAPAGLHYCSVLNAANYTELILQEWSEQVVGVEFLFSQFRRVFWSDSSWWV